MKKIITIILLQLCIISQTSSQITKTEKQQLKVKVLEMFDHAFGSYMKYGYPADEIMPLSCKGRYRDLVVSRGDIDEVLGNYTLTLVDSLDTLALLGRIDQFENAVKNVMHIHFDRDLIISVFESNIRMLGGLISGHVSLIHLKKNHYPKRFKWYNNELLLKAKDLAERLLPAFNTSTGLPMSRVNLKYGITADLLNSEKDKFTCTACAGTLLLEFAVLSRLTGDKIFEEKATKTLDYIWDKRNRASDLVGTVINVNDGEWMVKDSSIGAGIDSYYEYLFKGYILLGDEKLLYRFNRHYDSLMKYMKINDAGSVADGSFMKTVHMHMPNRQAKNYIDALLAFWPGLQVLKGDLKGAIKMHESLHQIVQKHDFLPEAVLFDHSVYWGNHPLRPEFLESTYYLYKATKDDHYLQIAKKIVYQLEKYSRVKCGYAALSDVKTKQHEDRMDSFVFAETFKYLFLMFEEDDKLLFDLDEFIFSTEAHLLPLKMDDYALNKSDKLISIKYNEAHSVSQSGAKSSCPSLKFLFGSKDDKKILEETRRLRESVFKNVNEQSCQQQQQQQPSTYNIEINSINLLKMKTLPLRAADFVAGRKDHIEILNKLGIKLTTIQDGRVQLVHKTSDAESLDDAELGILFMTEMLELSKQKSFQLKHSSTIQVDDYKPVSIIILNAPFNGTKEYLAGPAQFGYDFRQNYGVFGKVILAEPIDACNQLKIDSNLSDKILVTKRGGCMFVEKARQAQSAGALGLIVIDNSDDTSHSSSALFAMSGDGVQNVKIPSLFLFGKEGNELLWNMRSTNDIIVFMGENNIKNKMNGVEQALNYNTEQLKSILFTDNQSPNSMLSLFNSKKQKQICKLSEYKRLKFFYDIINPIKVTDKDMKVFILDEAIDLIVNNKGERELSINIEALKSNINNDEEIERKCYDQLIARFEKSTNFLQLKNPNIYKNALFNLVKIKLDDSLKQMSGDIVVLKILANQLDIESKTVKRNDNEN